MNRKDRDVYLLGAGFARAISARMPLLQDLAERMGEALPAGTRIPPEVEAMMKQNFAHALSYLEQAQPWVTEAENLRHRALFLEMSTAIARDLDAAARGAGDAISTDAPEWLSRLVGHWHRNRSTVITLNYDTLIESVAMEMELDGREHVRVQDIYPPLLTDAAARSGEMRLPSRQPSFRLLKLHGSTNWYYSGRAAAFGEPIYYVPPERLKDPSKEDKHEHAQRLSAVSDKYPFLVPPIYDKSPLLTHETIRALWFRAGEALKEASCVICMGYSLPESDLTMNHFLRTSFNGSSRFVIVDPAEDVADKFARLFEGTKVRVERRTGSRETIPEFVTREVG